MPTKKSSYVRALETRLKTVEALQASNLASKSPSDSTTQDVQGPGVQLIIAALRGLNSPFPPPHTDDLTFANLAGSLQSLSIDNPDNHGFQGKSSQAMLIKAAVDLKSQTGPAMPLPTTIPTPTKPWSTKPVAIPFSLL